MIVYLRDYRHLFEGEDAGLAVQEALHTCRQHPGSTLKLGGGTLHFHAKYAFEKDYYISNNDHSRKSILFPLLGMDGVTIDGEGAELIFHGTVLPFVIDGSRNITVRNLTIDCAHPFFFQGTVTAAEPDRLDLEYDPAWYTVTAAGHALTFSCPEDGWQMTRDRLLVCEFDRKTGMPSAHLPPYIAFFPAESDGSFLSGMYRYLTPEVLRPGLLRLHGDTGCRHTVGSAWVGTFSGRENPGIFGNEAENLLLEDVTLYHTASMGVICQMCENVTLRRVVCGVRPGGGRLLSVNADATHFVNCSGAIRYEDCSFTNMLDDAGNVHGIYSPVCRRLDDHTLLLTFGHFQQYGICSYRPGDRVDLVEGRTLRTAASLTVRSARLLSEKLLRLETEEALPERTEGLSAENVTRMPELYIHRCTSGGNRPRGFLCDTCRHTEVTDCSFFNMNCAVHVVGDCFDWFESGRVTDLLIARNRFCNAAYAGGPVLCIDPTVPEGDAPFHRNIRIEDNLFELHEPRFLYARHAEGLVMKNNRWRRCAALPAHPPVGKDGIDANLCPKSEIQLPEELPAGSEN